MLVTITLKTVSVGTDVSITQEGIPDVIPAEACYLGWQESLTLLTQLVEPEIPQLHEIGGRKRPRVIHPSPTAAPSTTTARRRIKTPASRDPTPSPRRDEPHDSPSTEPRVGERARVRGENELRDPPRTIACGGAQREGEAPSEPPASTGEAALAAGLPGSLREPPARTRDPGRDGPSVIQPSEAV
jgi:hypothetical protein